MEIVEEFKIRLDKALAFRDMKPVDLAKRTGISESTISQYRSGYAKPKSDRLAIIASALNVNPAWLMGLDVPMKIEPTYLQARLNHEGQEITADIDIKPDDFEIKHAIDLYSRYRQAIPEIREAVDRLLKTSQSDT